MESAWNHNIEYHRIVHEALDGDRRRVLDVGAGDGFLARELHQRGHSVVAIDSDQATLTRARVRSVDSSIDWVLGDVMSYPFAPECFDAVLSVATLHHLPEREALRLLAGLIRPGGTLVVIGLARSRLPHDLPRELLAGVTSCYLRHRHGNYVEITAPTVWPPPSTFGEIHDLAADELPGVRYRRHLLWRYSLIWEKPVSSRP